MGQMQGQVLRLAIRLACLRNQKNLSNLIFEEIRDILQESTGIKIPGYNAIVKELQTLTGVTPRKYHACINSCVCFTGRLFRVTACPKCGERRFKTQLAVEAKALHPIEEDEVADDFNVAEYFPNAKPRRTVLYFPLIDILKLWYENPERARTMKAHQRNHDNRANEGDGNIEDFWDGDLYRKYLKQWKNLFGDLRDVAFSLSTDGVSRVKNKNLHTVTPFVIQILNIPPNLRVKRQHLIVPMIVPGMRTYNQIFSERSHCSPNNLDALLS